MPHQMLMENPRAFTRFLALPVAVLFALAAGLLSPNVPPALGQSGVSVPTITSVEFGDHTDRESRHFHGIGDALELVLTFSDEVTVTGQPEAAIQVGSNTRTAVFDSSQSGGSEVVFTYTVVEGDLDTDGAGAPANSVRLNGGTIQDANGNDANLSHAALATAGSDHLVDGVRPTVRRLQWILSTDGADGIYTVGNRLTAWVEFTESIAQTNTALPRMELDLEDDATGYAVWAPRDAYYFVYTVTAGAMQMDGAGTPENPIELNGGVLVDPAGNPPILDHPGIVQNPEFLIDGVAPTIQSLAITSNPGTDQTYSAGDTIEVTVTLSESVRVPNVATMVNGVRLSGIPTLTLTVGTDTRTADYRRVDGASVVFSYTVKAGDSAPLGIAVPSNAITLNGGRIQDDRGNANAVTNQAGLDHPALSADSGHRI